MRTRSMALGAGMIFAAVLSSCAETARVDRGAAKGDKVKGKLIFEDGFDKGLENWQPEGRR